MRGKVKERKSFLSFFAGKSLGQRCRNLTFLGKVLSLFFEIFEKEESFFGTFQKHVLLLKIATNNLNNQVKSGRIERIE